MRRKNKYIKCRPRCYTIRPRRRAPHPFHVLCASYGSDVVSAVRRRFFALPGTEKNPIETVLSFYYYEMRLELEWKKKKTKKPRQHVSKIPLGVLLPPPPPPPALASRAPATSSPDRIRRSHVYVHDIHARQRLVSVEGLPPRLDRSSGEHERGAPARSRRAGG